MRALTGLVWLGLIVLGRDFLQADTGFRNDGSATYADTNPPLHWDAKTNVLWLTKLKSSNASPLPMGERVIVTEEPNVLVAVNFKDGQVLWSVANGYGDILSGPDKAAYEDGAKKAAVVKARFAEEQKKVQEAVKASKQQPDSAELKQAVETAKAALDATGKEMEPLQKFLLPDSHNVNGYTTPSPVTDGKNIYVVFGSGVVAGFSLEGQRIWARILPVRPHSKYGQSASPRVVDGVLLVHFGNKLFAVDPASGVDKWVCDAPSTYGSPAVVGPPGRSVLLTPYGDAFAVADGKQLVTASKKAGGLKFPWNGPVAKDGLVYKMDEDGACAFRLDFEGENFLSKVWDAKIPGDRYYATAVASEDLIYNITQGKNLIALDIKDGTRVYEHSFKSNNLGTVYPSPVLAGGRLYVSGDDGVTVVVKPGRTYEELACNRLSPFRSVPVFVGKSMLIRTLNGLARIEETGQ